MKNNNLKNLVMFAIIFKLVQEEECKNNPYNLINLSNPDKKKRLIIKEKTHNYKENMEFKKIKRQEVAEKNIKLKSKNTKEIENQNKELKVEKKQETENENKEHKTEKKQEIVKNKKYSKGSNDNISWENKKDKYIKNFKEKKDKVKIKEQVFFKVPIVIANFETEITDRVFTKIENTFIDIKDVKNNIFIEESNLIKLDSNKGKLFVKGYIRSYIEYVTLEKVSKSSIITKTEGIISHKDFRKAININLLFYNNMKRGKSFSVDFNNNLQDEEAFLGKVENLDIKSVNNYKDIQNYYFQREKCYLTLKQSLLIKAKINILQKNIVFL